MLSADWPNTTWLSSFRRRRQLPPPGRAGAGRGRDGTNLAIAVLDGQQDGRAGHRVAGRGVALRRDRHGAAHQLPVSRQSLQRISRAVSSGRAMPRRANTRPPLRRPPRRGEPGIDADLTRISTIARRGQGQRGADMAAELAPLHAPRLPARRPCGRRAPGLPAQIAP